MPKESLVQLIRSQFPDVAFTNAELIKKGWDHDVLILDEKYIFRFAKEQLYKGSFQREVRFLNSFSISAPLRVPRYRWLSSDGTFGGYEMIKGTDLTAALFQTFSAENKAAIAEAMARFLTALHAIPVQQIETLGFAPYGSWKEECAERQRWFKDEFTRNVASKLTGDQRTFVERFAADFYYSKYDIQPVFGHFDLGHDHIMIGDNSISGIIDFGDARIGDPAEEFSAFFNYDATLATQIYALYEGPTDAHFLHRAYAHYIHKWMYIHYDALVRRRDDALWHEAQEQLDQIVLNGEMAS